MARKQNADLAIRISTELSEAIRHIAAEQDRTLSWVIRTALAAYVTDHDTDSKAAA